MKRAGRWFFSLAAAVSLLLCVATVGLWVRSYYASDRLTWPHPNFKPPPSRPNIVVVPSGDGHVEFKPSFGPLSELQFTGSLVVLGNRVVNSGLGAIEFVIDSPPWRRIEPMHLAVGLPPGHFAGRAATSRVGELNSKTVTTIWSFLGFSHDELSAHFADSIYPPPGTPKTVFVRRWTVPYWSLAVLSGILPVLWLSLKLRTGSRKTPGHCRVCGYDLRATPGRCPECGTVAVAPAEV